MKGELCHGDGMERPGKARLAKASIATAGQGVEWSGPNGLGMAWLGLESQAEAPHGAVGSGMAPTTNTAPGRQAEGWSFQ